MICIIYDLYYIGVSQQNLTRGSIDNSSFVNIVGSIFVYHAMRITQTHPTQPNGISNSLRSISPASDRRTRDGFCRVLLDF